MAKKFSRFILEKLFDLSSEKPKVSIYEKTFSDNDKIGIDVSNIAMVETNLEYLKKEKIIKGFKKPLHISGEKLNPEEWDITTKLHIKYSPTKIKQYIEKKYSEERYKQLIKSHQYETLKKMKDIIEILEEQKKLSNESDNENSNNIYNIIIGKKQFERNGIFEQDLSQILQMFSENENYWILPCLLKFNFTDKYLHIEWNPCKLCDTNLKNFKGSVAQCISKRTKSEEKKSDWYSLKDKKVTIFFDGRTYAPREKNIQKILEILVANHQVENKKGEIKKTGKRIKEKEFIAIVGLNLNVFREKKKQINRTLKEKKFPLRINSVPEGVLLIYTK